MQYAHGMDTRHWCLRPRWDIVTLQDVKVHVLIAVVQLFFPVSSFWLVNVIIKYIRATSNFTHIKYTSLLYEFVAWMGRRRWSLRPCRDVGIRGVMGMGTVGILRNPPADMGLNVAGIPRGWIWQLRDSRGDGFFSPGTLREWSTNSAVKNVKVHTVFRQTRLMHWRV